LEGATPGRIYLVHGEETFLVERTLGILRRRFAPAAEWRVVWGDDDEERVRRALEARVSRGLFGGSTTVVVRRVEAMRGAVEGLVEAAAGDASAEGCLLLVGGAIDRRKRWYTAVRSVAEEIVCAPLDDLRDVRGWIEALAGERSLRFAGEAIAELTERCGFDLSLLDGEVEKLALAGLSQPITGEAVRRLVAGVRTHAVEALTDRLARGDGAGAVRVLRGLLAADEAPLRLLGFLAANLRRALHVAEEHERGAGVEEIAAHLGVPEWLVRRQLGRGSARRLEGALEVLARLDLDLKRSRPDAVVFEVALGELGRVSSQPSRGG
jgi:DNA polymerase-3 subunit delta